MARKHCYRRGNSPIANRENALVGSTAIRVEHKRRATTTRDDNGPVLSLRQEPAMFGGSALPKTMRLAARSRRLIEGEFWLGSNEWPYKDRVLAWLVPELTKDIEKFHLADGPPMSALFKTHQTEHLDRDLENALTVRLLQLYAKIT